MCVRRVPNEARCRSSGKLKATCRGIQYGQYSDNGGTSNPRNIGARRQRRDRNIQRNQRNDCSIDNTSRTPMSYHHSKYPPKQAQLMVAVLGGGAWPRGCADEEERVKPQDRRLTDPCRRARRYVKLRDLNVLLSDNTLFNVMYNFVCYSIRLSLEDPTNVGLNSLGWLNIRWT